MAGKTEGQSVQTRGETCIGDDGGYDGSFCKVVGCLG